MARLPLTRPCPTEDLDRLGHLYGRGKRITSGNWGGVSAGPSLVVGDRDGAEFQTVGVAVEAMLIGRRGVLIPNGPLRFAISGVGNLNPEVPFVGFVVSLQLGKMP